MLMYRVPVPVIVTGSGYAVSESNEIITYD